jgi:hypothetical protein
MRTRWSIAIHHEDRSKDSLISEDHFVHFADVHERMKKNKDKVFVVRIPKTAKPLFKRSMIFDGWATESRPFSRLIELGAEGEM